MAVTYKGMGKSYMWHFSAIAANARPTYFS
jgi:hypothetical protein